MGRGKLVESHPLYSFRCDLENVLNYSVSGASVLAPGFYFPIDAKNMTAERATHDDSFSKRIDYFQNGEIITVAAPVRCDLFQQGKLLPNYTNLRLEILPNSTDFCIYCPNDGRVAGAAGPPAVAAVAGEALVAD
ncbi:MAG: hypothetical protein GY696_05135 [Gammaproteobacteria bacterium]|nr:hypothetical protein [Gammaproteobacteria bacterium]